MDQVQKEFAEVRTERDDAAARAACAEMKVEQHKVKKLKFCGRNNTVKPLA